MARAIGRKLVALLALACLVACAPTGGSSVDGQPGVLDASSWPLPRTDLVPSVGTASTVDIATWNIENFPLTPDTALTMADLITSLDLDLVAVQEIASETAFTELVQRLPEHEGVLSQHEYGDGSYQKVGFIYRVDLLTLSESRLLFTTEGYVLPRPPLETTVTVVGAQPAFDFILVTVHHKAGRNNEDFSRRTQANALLEGYVRGLVDGPRDDEVCLFGDFNEILQSNAGQAVMAPWLGSPARYRIHTQALANANQTSFIPTNVLLDHIVCTTAVDGEVGPQQAFIPPLDAQLQNYETRVSDHLPVVLRLPVLP